MFGYGTGNKGTLDLSHPWRGEYLAVYTPGRPWTGKRPEGLPLPRGDMTSPPQVGCIKRAGTAYLGAPCIIGLRLEVRHCAFIRARPWEPTAWGGQFRGAEKRDPVRQRADPPHYNYVGDSILGYKSHMGAGSITSNVKSDKTLVTVKNGAERIETGRKKFGAILGDFHVEGWAATPC